MIAFLVGSFFVLFLLIFIAFLVTSFFAFRSAPPISLTKRAAKLMLRVAGLKSGEKAYDLGAGIGKLVIVAKNDFDLDIFGIEFSPFVWFVGRLNLFFHGLNQKQLIFGDFFKKDLSKADVIFCYLGAETMTKIAEKLKTKTSARLVSYVFRLPGFTPTKIIRGTDNDSVYLYEISRK
ncbi:MAG: N-6 DNA methylase [Patescibacteria group bacterium]